MRNYDRHEESSGPAPKCAVVVCGDAVSSLRGLPANIALIRCSEDREQLFALCQHLSVSVFVCNQSFLAQIPSFQVQQLAFGRRSYGLVILDGQTVDAATAAQILRLGCRGVLPKGCTAKVFTRAISAVLRGELWAPRAVVSQVLSELLRVSHLNTNVGLTPQEAKILELASQGYKNSAIAEALFISLETVRWHKRRLNRKLQNQQPQGKSSDRKLQSMQSLSSLRKTS
jgi:DNA-binding NarL/FixJ family response regulator